MRLSLQTHYLSFFLCSLFFSSFSFRFEVLLTAMSVAAVNASGKLVDTTRVGATTIAIAVNSVLFLLHHCLRRTSFFGFCYKVNINTFSHEKNNDFYKGIELKGFPATSINSVEGELHEKFLSCSMKN